MWEDPFIYDFKRIALHCVPPHVVAILFLFGILGGLLYWTVSGQCCITLLTESFEL